jgi:Invasion associated locus B (IalB) protein
MMILKSKISALIATVALGAWFTGQALAADPELLGSYDDWSAYTYKAADTKVCYAVSSPKSSESKKKVKRDPIFFLVTHMPGRKIRGEVSTIIGYPFKESTLVKLVVDDAEFELFTNGDGAWADAPAKEKQIVTAMKSGKALKVTGTSWKGTETTDTYSLAGISAAMDKIDSACK